MLFNSIGFLQFLLLFLPCYALARKSVRARNLLITVASYGFYSAWDPRFVVLLFASTLVDYLAGLTMHRVTAPALRRTALLLSLVVNLGVLATFKYADFAAQTAADLLRFLGMNVAWQPIGWTLPVGISFYTFQTLGYSLDVYRRRIPAESSFVRFAGYVAFFPQLVAGPIERAERLLPQFHRLLPVTTKDILDGTTLVIQGLFKKVVLADPLGRLVELAYDSPGIGAPVLLLGTVAFGFQIYCDFSGYTDIARGVARWLGFSLSLNFQRPYLATTIRDFWSRWHITLSTWLRDYLYIPLGGSRAGPARTAGALLGTMLLGGLWHGASLNFLLWGLWHGMVLVIAHLGSRHPSLPHPLPRPLSWLLTMIAVFYGWLLFRAGNVDNLYHLHLTLLEAWSWPAWGGTYLLQIVLLAGPLFAVELACESRRTIPGESPLPVPFRILFEALLLLGVLVFWTDDPPAFIYFQF